MLLHTLTHNKHQIQIFTNTHTYTSNWPSFGGVVIRFSTGAFLANAKRQTLVNWEYESYDLNARSNASYTYVGKGKGISFIGLQNALRTKIYKRKPYIYI